MKTYGTPEYNSQKTQPIAQTSTGVPYCRSPTNNSGARYHLVATNIRYFRLFSLLQRTYPHSQSFPVVVLDRRHICTHWLQCMKLTHQPRKSKIA